MNRLSSAVGVTLALLMSAAGIAQAPIEQPKAVTIPLKQIWAYDMPGTRDVRELEPKPDRNTPPEELTRRWKVWQIFDALKRPAKQGAKAGPAFVVLGTGKEALENAAAVITSPEKKKEPPTVFPPDTDLSLVFYSHRYGLYLQLVSVEQSPQRITVKYHFVAHLETMSSAHFALIPIGKLPEGTVQVEIEQMPLVYHKGLEVQQMRNANRLVCDSTSFTVEKK